MAWCDDGRGGSSPKGAVGVPPAVGRGQEARGAKWCSWRACDGGREGGRKGLVVLAMSFIGATGSRGKRGGVHVEERETSGERGVLTRRSTAGHWPVADGRERAAHVRHDA
jgi:hypothetical protein